MNQPVTLNQVRQMPLSDVAALPVIELARLQKEVAEAISQTKLVSDLLNGVLARRFSDRATAIRQESGKEFGVVRFHEDNVEVVTDVKKDVKWDQGQLVGIVQTIRNAGDNPAQYVKTTFDVSERKYTAWPDSIRRVFEPARTVKAGKPSFKLTLREQEVA